MDVKAWLAFGLGLQKMIHAAGWLDSHMNERAIVAKLAVYCLSVKRLFP